MGYKWKSKPAVICPDGTAIVPITRGMSAIIDAEDALSVSQFRWHAAWCKTSNGKKFNFARRSFKVGVKTKSQSLHGFLTGVELTDHKDGNPFNCRRSNLRPATQQQNCWNRSKMRISGKASSNFRGVSWNPHRSNWRARITQDGKQILIGDFKNEQAAAEAYRAKEIELRGEFAGSLRRAA